MGIMIYDVIVVGAGPAGSTAAKCISEKGFNVLLLDKERFPRPKPCGGGVPISTLKRFPYLQDYDLIECYSYGGFIHSPSLKYSLKLDEEKPIGGTFSREKFDHGLTRIAVENGTHFIDGKTAIDVKISKDKAQVFLKDGSSFESKIIIGADGVSSIIAKKSGLGTFKKIINVCVFQEYNVGKKTVEKYSTEKRALHIHLMYDGIAGYAWLFPKKECFNIGIGEFLPLKKHSTRKKKLIDVYKSYFELLKQKKLIPKDLAIGRCKGGVVPSFPLKKTYSDRLLLCGDAAGFINPVSGGGIYFAMVSGELAAGVTTKALESDDFHGSFLSQYQTLWKEDFGKDLHTFAHFANIWLGQTERFIRVACKDERFTKIASDFLYGNLRIRDYRWKLIFYYIQDWLKNSLDIP